MTRRPPVSVPLGMRDQIQIFEPFVLIVLEQLVNQHAPGREVGVILVIPNLQLVDAAPGPESQLTRKGVIALPEKTELAIVPGGKPLHEATIEGHQLGSHFDG